MFVIIVFYTNYEDVNINLKSQVAFFNKNWKQKLESQSFLINNNFPEVNHNISKS